MIRNSLLSLVFLFGLSSCSVLEPLKDKITYEHIQNARKYAYPASKLTASAILKMAKTESDKEQKAKIILSISDALMWTHILNMEQAPSQKEIIEKLNEVIPADKSHWILLTTTIAENYTLFLTEKQKVTVSDIGQFFTLVQEGLHDAVLKEYPDALEEVSTTNLD